MSSRIVVEEKSFGMSCRLVVVIQIALAQAVSFFIEKLSTTATHLHPSIQSFLQEPGANEAQNKASHHTRGRSTFRSTAECWHLDHTRNRKNLDTEKRTKKMLSTRWYSQEYSKIARAVHNDSFQPRNSQKTERSIVW